MTVERRVGRSFVCVWCDRLFWGISVSDTEILGHYHISKLSPLGGGRETGIMAKFLGILLVFLWLYQDGEGLLLLLMFLN